MSEMEIMKRCMLAVTRIGARVFRNNTGIGWVGAIRNHTPQYLTLINPRPLHAGLCKGSSDLIGWVPITVSQEMVGKTLAVFAAIEVKSKTGKTTKEQEQFIRVVLDSGGIAFVARDESDIDEHIRRITAEFQKSRIDTTGSDS